MGFTTAIATAVGAAGALANTVSKAGEARALRQQATGLNQAAEVRERLAGQQASALTDVALENRRRGTRNAEMQMSHARADAAASNLAEEGSVYRREVDLATRLEDEINANANAALEQAGAVRRQGAYDAWDLRNQAANAKLASRGTMFSAAGSLFSGLGTLLK